MKPNTIQIYKKYLSLKTVIQILTACFAHFTPKQVYISFFRKNAHFSLNHISVTRSGHQNEGTCFRDRKFVEGEIEPETPYRSRIVKLKTLCKCGKSLNYHRLNGNIGVNNNNNKISIDVSKI